MTATRPFKVLGVQQLAVGGTDKSALAELWREQLGLRQAGSFRSVTENVDEDIYRIGDGPTSVEVDLMQPLDPSKSPSVARPALNHVGLWVDDLAAAYSWLSGRGVRFATGGIRSGASGHDICFIHPKPSSEFPIAGSGVLIELVQAPPSVIAAYGSRGN